MAGYEAKSFVFLAVFIVIIHVTSWGLLLSHMNNSSLFGKQLFQFNRYYSTKTVHVHKSNILPPASNPSHWESLGLVIPASDENYLVQKYFVDTDDVKSLKTECEHSQTAACWLENNHGDYVFLNGESMSPLSEISPSIYFGTLLTIYLLSSIVIVSNTLAYFVKKWMPETEFESVERNVRYFLISINLLVYILSIFFAYGTTPFINETKILGVKVEYTISSHFASILTCALTLILYLLHLRGRQIKWFEEQEEVSEIDANPESEPNSRTVNFDNGTASFQQQLYNPLSYERMSLTSGNGVYFVNTNTNTTTMNYLGMDKVSDQLDKILDNEKKSTSNIQNGPNSSESSIIGPLTVFLGGIGSLGLARGILQEVEVQIVLACTLGFVFLEICSYRMVAYFNYMFGILKSLKQLDEDTSKTKWFYCVNFIRFVCLWIELWLLIVYYNTILHVKLLEATPQYIVYALMFFYWTVSFFIYLSIINETMLNYKLKFEIGYCVIAFIILSISLLVYTGNTSDLQIDDSLVRYENIQYDLKTVIENTKCGTAGKLKSSTLVHDDIKKNEVSLATNDNWVGRNEVDVVELKVYYWTKGWNVQILQKPNFVAWFCKNGLEHHWGQCIFSTQYFCGPSNQPISATQCEEAVVAKIQSGLVVKYY